MNIYIAGKITGLEKEVYSKAFNEAEELIKQMGHTPINPIKIVPQELSYDDQMHLCLALVDISEAVMMLDNWVDSPGATKELILAATQEKKILYYDEQKEMQCMLATHERFATPKRIWITSNPPSTMSEMLAKALHDITLISY